MSERIPTVVQHYLREHPECSPSKPWYKSKRTWSGVAFVLSGGGTILNKVAHGKEGLELAAMVCTLTSGLLVVVFNLRDSGTRIDMPNVSSAMANSRTVQDAREVMRRTANFFNREKR